MSFLDHMARDVGRALRDVFQPCMYVETTGGTLNATTGELSASATVNYRCRAIIEEYSAYHLANSLVQIGDRKVTILADTLRITPKPGDKVTVVAGTTATIIKVTADPAGATWTLQVR